MATRKPKIEPIARVKKRVPKKQTSPQNNFVIFRKGFLIAFFLIISIIALGYYFRLELAYYFSFKSKHSESLESVASESHIFAILEKHHKKVIGIDISEYQGTIKWEKVKFVQDSFPIQFVMVRATAGSDKVDAKFATNWEQIKQKQFVRGAYHYYRPNENSIAQAKNFIATVKLTPGDLPPVLDIENLPKKQSMDSLKVGLKRWLNYIENHYKVRPIIYSGENYYQNFLKNDFPEYQFWIANYNGWVHEINPDWLIWQFTEKATVEGIRGTVDLNIYNGTPKMLQYLVRK
uniref:glycoside hydrolase family 25 protein n=1 Tax=Flavobacterium sp. TaxID=239 RepID=UPI00404A7E27